MPRRSATSAAVPSQPITQHMAPSSLQQLESSLFPELDVLRKQWQWAAFSQFFVTFASLFAMSDVTLTAIEEDLTRSTTTVLPRVMHRLLVTLTQDRKITLDTWQTALRKQYAKRDPLANPLGPPPDIIPQDHATPPLTPQVEIQPTTEEAHSESPDDSSSKPELDQASTGDGEVLVQEEAVVQDGQDGDVVVEESKDWLDLPMLEKLHSMHLLTEWQFHNPHRLRTIMKDDDEGAQWRIEPIGYDAKSNAYWLIGSDRLWLQRVIPRPKTLKRKRTTKAENVVQKSSKAHRASVKRQRVSEPSPSLPSASKSRKAKVKANQKLENQAKELAALQNAVAQSESRRKAPARSMGTRVSARLRTEASVEEWQPVPDEWLEEGAKVKGARMLKTGLESDDGTISDLTELSDEGEEQDDTPAVEEQDLLAAPEDAKEDEELENPPLPEGFVEWETICVTLYEWEHVTEQFEKATHFREKALYKTLVNNIVPSVIAELKEIERQKRLEEAIVTRKRSSRIQVKESEREIARAAAQQRLEEAQTLNRARRMEARMKKEEEDRQKREAAREQRRLEREAKDQKAAESSETLVDVVGTDDSFADIGAGSGTRTPAGEEWELDCEICRRRGMNQDDGAPMMCCGKCYKWQHIKCHDRADMLAGRAKRNWDKEEFVCKTCSGQPRTSRQPYERQKATSQNSSAPRSKEPKSSRPRAPEQSLPHQTNILHPPPILQSGHVLLSNGTHFDSYSQRAPPLAQYHQQPAISFAHYQPHHHGFSPQVHQSYYVAPPPQPYTTSMFASSSTGHLHQGSPQTPASLYHPPQVNGGWAPTAAGYPQTHYSPAPIHRYLGDERRPQTHVAQAWQSPYAASPHAQAKPSLVYPYNGATVHPPP